MDVVVDTQDSMPETSNFETPATALELGGAAIPSALAGYLAIDILKKGSSEADRVRELALILAKPPRQPQPQDF